MNVLLATIPVSIFLGLLGLAAFLWSLKRGQYRDLEGDAARILFTDDSAPPSDAPSGGPSDASVIPPAPEAKADGAGPPDREPAGRG